MRRPKPDSTASVPPAIPPIRFWRSIRFFYGLRMLISSVALIGMAAFAFWGAGHVSVVEDEEGLRGVPLLVSLGQVRSAISRNATATREFFLTGNLRELARIRETHSEINRDLATVWVYDPRPASRQLVRDCLRQLGAQQRDEERMAVQRLRRPVSLKEFAFVMRRRDAVIADLDRLTDRVKQDLDRMHDEVNQAEYDTKRRVGLILAGAVPVLWLMSWVGTRRTLRPLADLTWAAREVAAGDRPVAVPVRADDEFGAVARAFSAMSERVASRTALLAASEERFRAMFEHAAVGIALVDAEGYIRERNKALACISRRSDEEVLDQPFVELVAPEDRPRSLAAFHDLMARKVRSYQIDHRIIRQDGSLNWVRMTVSRVPLNGGASVGAVAMLEDVQARVEAVEALRESRERLLAAESVAHLGSWEWDLVHRRIYWSDELFRLFGLEPGSFEPTYDRAIALLHADDRGRIRRDMQRGFVDRRVYPIEFRGVLSSGEVRWFRSQGHMTCDERGRPIQLIGTTQDVTERRRAEAEIAARTAELEEANRHLREVDRYKDEFLAIISHELLTPLNLIIGFQDLLSDEAAGPLPSQAHAFLGQIREGAQRLLQLVHRLIDMSRITAGRFQVYPHPEYFGLLVSEAVEGLGSKLRERHLSVEQAVDASEPVEVDPARILQVLSELLENAMKVSPPGGTIRLSAHLEGDRLVCQVMDRGPGIAPERLPMLFQRFGQLDTSSTRTLGGTGLGLAIAKAIVEAHGGQIGVVSELGEGATFWFSLPQPSAPSREGVPAAETSARPLNG
jgi:PAS domain S-box-containing protein